MRVQDYRHELDGVRAIAVVSVVLFHVGYVGLSGGYSGVDIFFVLSGYLICGQTYIYLRDGSYSALDFFARRIRRLSSAYFICFVVTALVANALFLRAEMGEVFSNLLGSTTFTNNFNLLNSAGYFENRSEENPFLHTWSLSIEEQFYIALPLAVLAMGKRLTPYRGMLLVVLVISLGLTLFSGDALYTRDQRYFSTALRVWELALGAVAFIVLERRGRPQRSYGLPLVGLMMVLVPVFVMPAGIRYPSWVTLVPTLGVALILLTGFAERSRTARVLASRPFAYVGQISYGTYLWHWPVIVFVQYAGVVLDDVKRAGLFFAALTLGALSHHLVETPIRRLSIAAHRTTLFGLFGVQTAILLALAGYLYTQSKTADQFETAGLEKIHAESEAYHAQWNECWDQRAIEDLCRFGPVDASKTGAPDFVLWGDSMANSAFWAFDDFGRDTGQTGVLITSPSCVPAVGISRDFGSAGTCLESNRTAIKLLAEMPPTTVYLFARWSYYSEGYASHRTDVPGGVGLVDAGGAPIPGDPAAVWDAVGTAVAHLAARHEVVLINQAPVFPYFVPKEMLKARRFGITPAPVTTDRFEARNGAAVAAVRAMAARHGAALIELHEEICIEGECAMARDGAPLFSDHVHLSHTGNALVKDLLVAERQGR